MEPRRLENFRKGDRAEKLGIFLLQSFCAIAEVPRQEDFGLSDAVATLLRRQDRFLIAEDSFLVQFKSRTETLVEFLDGRFKALIGQDLPLFLGHVNLLTGTLELHTLGVALAHPNINEVAGIVAHLQGTDSEAGFKENALHVALNKPILRMSVSETESTEFTTKAYKVLKEWLKLERWNRRYRRSGISQQINWETNNVPSSAGASYMWSPGRAQDALEELVPLISILASHALRSAELRPALVAIVSWLRGHGVESDPAGTWAVLIGQAEVNDCLKKILDANPRADIACTFRVVGVGEDHLDFWLLGQDRDGKSSASRYTGTLDSIREKRFSANIESMGNQARIDLGFSEEWLSTHRVEPASPSHVTLPSVSGSQTEEVLLLRKLRDPPSNKGEHLIEPIGPKI
jgi:hypothetical protein